MSILITGGCGFVGANLIARLKELGGPPVRVLDNESMGKYAWIEDLGVDFIKGDLRDAEAVARAVDGVDAVVHLAADTRVMDSIENPSHNFASNVVGTFNLLEAMRAAGVKRIVNASTGGAIIGEVPPPVHEGMVPSPVSPYGAAKLAVEGYLSAYAGSYGLDAVSLRFSNVYGRRSYHKGSVVAAFLRCIADGKPITVYGDGSQTRDYVFADDLCDGILAATDARCSGVYQLGTGIATSINDLIALMDDVTGSDYPVEVIYEDFRCGELLHTYCQISKAQQAFGYAPDTRLPEGIAKTWDWFNACRQGRYGRR